MCHPGLAGNLRRFRFRRTDFRDSHMPRSARYLLPLIPLLVALAAAGVVAYDWWSGIPKGQEATYVGRQVCAECHAEEMDHWHGSDHDMAMDHATSETVLGDFDGTHFTHIAFDDLIKLSAVELAAVVAEVDSPVWAVALTDAQPELRAAVLAAMPEDDRQETVEELAWIEGRVNAGEATDEAAPQFLAAGHKLVRPCDVADAHIVIGDVARRLADEGRIGLDFAVTSHMSREGEKFFITTDNRNGEMEKFPVKYVFGVRPLQQYLVEFPDGRIQCLPITWDTERKTWYHLYPKEPIPHDDVLHWTRSLQNWNYMCAECHTTNLQKNFDVATNTYETTWSEIDVSCETCHGPGSIHVELAEGDGKFGFWDRNYRYGLPNLKDENPRVEIENCAPCHARRRVIYPNDQSGSTLCDHYVTELIDDHLYYADGQILEEDYVYGSFIQSRMYDEQVRCTDCHDPHSVRVKFNDNRLCTQCHTKAQYDTTRHHHHPDATQPGTLCVECHMPETKYMGCDPRRDHSLRVPRPDLTVELGIPNACNGCHHDRAKGETAQWAADQIVDWYGEQRADNPHFAHGIAGGRELDPAAISKLRATCRNTKTRAAVRAAAMSLLSRYGDVGTAEALRGLEDDDPLVRTTAVSSLQQLPAAMMLRHLVPMLRDPVRSVRIEAVRLLSQLSRSAFNANDLPSFDAALKEYIDGQGAVADQAGAHLNLAVVYANLAQAHHGDPDRPEPTYLKMAENAYRTAIRIEPDFVPARNNLAMLCDALGRKDEAAALFREIIEIDPEMAEAYYSLGLLLAENEDRMAEATDLLGQAAELSPDNARIHYNYGLALQKIGRLDEAEQALKDSLRVAGLSQQSLSTLHALAILNAQRKRWGPAIACVEQLIQMQPQNGQWQELLQQYRQASGANTP